MVESRQVRKARSSQDAEPGAAESSDAAELAEGPGWKEQLLGQLMGMRPDAFERFAQCLLREADFDSVKVTGKSGDGGIDGLGVCRLGLVSFPVFFQC